ncbi:MAG: hypothetical protein ACRDT2_12985, partial [Natronosporangium sp.]
AMSMSLDGFIADVNDYLGGDDDHRLHNWFAPGGEFVKPSGPGRGAAGRARRGGRRGGGPADRRADGSLGR